MSDMIRCMRCMKQYGKEYGVCPHCGHVNGSETNPLYLTEGTVLEDKYIIGTVLGHGGFGITYVAYDASLERKVAIKEYFPLGVSTRAEGNPTIFSLKTQEAENNFIYGRDKFIEEARTLARFNSMDSIVSVISCFTQNNTAYIVMEYLDGEDLLEYVKHRNGKIGWDEALKLISPVFDALEAIHATGLIHRDISPDNIFITKDGKTKLLDFGTARFALGEKSKSLSVILKPGYAPREQYYSRGRQGPWTDVYALAATIYRVVSGRAPADSVERQDITNLDIANELTCIPPHAKTAILKALELDQTKRYQSIREFRQALSTQGKAAEAQAVIQKDGRTVTPIKSEPIREDKEPKPAGERAKKETPVPAIKRAKEPKPPKSIAAMSRKTKLILGITACAVTAGLVTGLAIGLGDNRATQIPAAASTSSAPAEEDKPINTATGKPMKIAYFVSDLSNVFYQAQVKEATRYAKEKYNADVYVFDGKSDGNVMTQNVDQIVAQGMDMATLHIWDVEAARPGIENALQKGIIINTYFSPLGDMGISTVRNNEPGVSREMGAQMATQWKAAHPDKPIVCVELGWPNHTEVKSGRTDPFVEGVKSVDPDATDLGCIDASQGTERAMQITSDLITTHPDLNLIYSESSSLTTGIMDALAQTGRGRMDNGKPLTEIVCSADFDEVQCKEIYDPGCSLKLSMGIPPIETARARIDNLFEIRDGKWQRMYAYTPFIWAKAYCISFWTMKQEDAEEWLTEQFAT